MGFSFVSVRFWQMPFHPPTLINLLPEVFWGRGGKKNMVGMCENFFIATLIRFVSFLL